MTRRPAPLVQATAAFTAAAALVHAAAAGTHTGDTALVWLFTAAAAVQVLVAIALLARPVRVVIVAATLVNASFVALWLLSRTVGIGFVEALSTPESIGVQDLAATLLEAGAVATALAALVASEARSRKPLALVSVLAIAGALTGMSAPHEHDASHEHDHGHDDAVVATDHDGTDHDGTDHDGTDHDGTDHDGTDPGNTAHEHDDGSDLAVDAIFTGADTSSATGEELAAAKELIEQTRTAVAATFADEASVVAAGYRSIGDGRRDGSFEHFVNAAYLTDGNELDPQHIESLVFEVSGGEKRLVSAMYILESGTTMADVPHVAGELTTWHDHQNLCWNAAGQIAGVLVDGTCTPGGVFRGTSPMLHVWLEDHECGPFAGIERHGGGDCATHEH